MEKTMIVDIQLDMEVFGEIKKAGLYAIVEYGHDNVRVDSVEEGKEVGLGLRYFGPLKFNVAARPPIPVTPKTFLMRHTPSGSLAWCIRGSDCNFWPVNSEGKIVGESWSRHASQSLGNT